MMKHEPEALMMDHHQTRGAFHTHGDHVAVHAMKTNDYFWIRKVIAGIVLIGLLIVFIIFGFIVHFLSLCSEQDHSHTTQKIYDDLSIRTTTVMQETNNNVFNYIENNLNEPILPESTTDKISTTIRTQEFNKTEPEININLLDESPKINYNDYRLTKSVKPMQYELNIVPLFSKSENNKPVTFKGYVNITIHVMDIVHELRLHATAMSLNGLPKVISVNNNYQTNENVLLKVNGYELNETNQFLTIKTNSSLLPGKYYLIIQFTGAFNDLMRGFYRSSYTKNNKTAWIVATQFEPTDARRAFPCFDEPDLKARFRIRLGRPKYMSSLSNMNLEETLNFTDYTILPELPSKDFVWDIFNNTELMSTYLVGFAILDFKSIRHFNNFTVWTRESVIKEAEYALDLGEEVLKYFEDFFNIKYPLPKMDMLALPDFAAGAMENWGLTTFRESAMLYLKGVSPTESRKRVATVISHELAHQWFGNLVTPKWWSDLWLNEGFASYVEYIGVDFVNPEWEVDAQFVIDEVHYVMGLDSLASSHQISVEVHHHDEINDIFDRISYSKGASIIRMMDHFLSRETFQKGLTTYLNEQKYGNAEQDDLWKCLTHQAHLDKHLDKSMSVKEIMDTWTLQVGYPVITLTRNYEENTGILNQTRFLLNPKNVSSKKANTSNELWFVPINVATKLSDFNDTRPQKWMNTKTLKIDNLPKERWAIINIQETGFYRVNYDYENWKLIFNQLITNHTEIHELNRAQILDDTMNLARSGLLSYNMALSLTTYLKNERHYLPWKAGFNSLSYINSMLIRTGDYHYFKKYVLNLIETAYKQIGFTEKSTDSQLELLLRIDLIQWACLLDEYKCMQQSVTMFQNWMVSPDPDSSNIIPADIRGIIYCTAIRQGTELEWNFAWQRYLNTDLGFEKETLLSALGCSREPWILTRYLEWAISEKSGVRRQDVTRVFSSVAHNPIGRDLGFDFVKNNWKQINKYFDSSTSLLISIVRACVQERNTEFEKLELFQWIKGVSKELGVGLRSIQQVMESIDANIHWMEMYKDKVSLWIQNYLKKPIFELSLNAVQIKNDRILSPNKQYQALHY